MSCPIVFSLSPSCACDENLKSSDPARNAVETTPAQFNFGTTAHCCLPLTPPLLRDVQPRVRRHCLLALLLLSPPAPCEPSLVVPLAAFAAILLRRALILVFVSGAFHFVASHSLQDGNLTPQA